jgi:ssDNA-binding replication factor A large subunit
MTQNTAKLGELRPGMEHLDFKVKIAKIKGVRKVKTYTGVEHSILEGEIIDGANSMGFAVWNEKIELFNVLSVGDMVELTDCFVTSFKGVLQINVGRDSCVTRVST